MSLVSYASSLWSELSAESDQWIIALLSGSGRTRSAISGKMMTLVPTRTSDAVRYPLSVRKMMKNIPILRLVAVYQATRRSMDVWLTEMIENLHRISNRVTRYCRVPVRNSRHPVDTPISNPVEPVSKTGAHQTTGMGVLCWIPYHYASDKRPLRPRVLLQSKISTGDFRHGHY